ncbi:uncharacterized protein G2W53_028719 [Senna tora]|uniref:Uncharacterized protein n=1 Tax=Senna tora TaxID=362788 RepID=A0A834T387_9FABA|nr:uncharacterized protein G2W53_028719 [Senna tora]
MNIRFKCTTNTAVDTALECQRSYHNVVRIQLHHWSFVTVIASITHNFTAIECCRSYHPVEPYSGPNT